MAYLDPHASENEEVDGSASSEIRADTQVQVDPSGLSASATSHEVSQASATVGGYVRRE